MGAEPTLLQRYGSRTELTAEIWEQNQAYYRDMGAEQSLLQRYGSRTELTPEIWEQNQAYYRDKGAEPSLLQRYGSRTELTTEIWEQNRAYSRDMGAETELNKSTTWNQACYIETGAEPRLRHTYERHDNSSSQDSSAQITTKIMNPNFIQEVAPEFLLNLADIICVVGDTVTLRCKVCGRPKPNITWRGPDQSVLDGDCSAYTMTSSESGDIRLRICNLMPQDSGIYTCVATNEHGSASTSATIKVQGVPGAPSQPIAQERSSTSVILRWLPPSSTGYCTISGYTVEYKDEGSSVWQQSVACTLDTYLVLEDLRPGGTYQFKVSASNPWGLSLPSDPSEPLRLPEIDANADGSAIYWKENFEQVYLEQQEIGRGRFSVVKRCIQKNSRKEFAVKFVNKKMKKREQAAHEAALLQHLQHPQYITVHDTYESPGAYILVLDLSNKEDLMGACPSWPCEWKQGRVLLLPEGQKSCFNPDFRVTSPKSGWLKVRRVQRCGAAGPESAAMTRRRQKDAGTSDAGVGQDGSDAREDAEKENAACQRRMEVAAKLQQYARVEAAEEAEPGSGADQEEEEASKAEQHEQSLNSLAQQMQEVKGDTAQINAALQKMDKRIGVVEERVSTAEDHIVKLQKAEKKFAQAIAELAAKNEDLENRSRRNNIRIVGLPEKTEGRNPTEFVENWLLEKIGSTVLTKVFAVERAHRVPPQPPAPGANPRTMLAKILNYRDRDIILRKAREMEDLTAGGQKIAIYPDYSAAVQKQRMKFTGVKRRLRELGVQYSVMFPAKLRLVAFNKTHFFLTPEDATQWLDTHEKKT
ncbi:unnamed protein product [Ranitomeya imitator]|uniref:Uncharacterized protein n=1 Tax=Ranitomeya imitator TaxID=111125 RepID=A0ABN9MJT6_9NEOB|nr:unnamed protein product [Ranitomeya imitator]